MPKPTMRGPGKKENYNLDYSRFDAGASSDEDEGPKKKNLAPEADAAGGPAQPTMQELVAGMPRDLQDAYQLMAIARQNNDPVAERRATELVLQGIEKGGPEVKAAFLKNVSQQMPDVAVGLEQGHSLDDMVQAQYEKEVAKKTPEKLGTNIDVLRKQLEAGREATRVQMEALKAQQDELENMQHQSPEAIMKFMSGQGMKPEDVQRIFGGDQMHMESCVRNMIDKVGTDPAQDGAGDKTAETAVAAAEALHNTICMDGVPDPGAQLALVPEPAPAKPKRVVPKEPEVIIPDHRLQYGKDADGRYETVSLTCSLPGVADMSMICLDVSERHLRLNTSAPAPLYAVNAGPFPVLIDPSAARAKFSKKRSELVITVPAKASS